MIYAALIFYLSSQPIPEEAPLPSFPGSDKLIHWTEYFLFGLLALKACSPKSGRGVVVVVFISIGYAASDELHQLFVPTRVASIFDWGVDSLGVLSGLFLRRWFPDRF